MRIEHADALAADNTASLLPGETATATIAPRILLVSDLPGALARALMAIENVQLTIEPGDNLAAIAAGGYDLVVFDRTAPSTETLAKIDTASLWVGPPVGGPFATAEGVTDPRSRGCAPVIRCWKGSTSPVRPLDRLPSSRSVPETRRSSVPRMDPYSFAPRSTTSRRWS